MTRIAFDTYRSSPREKTDILIVRKRGGGERRIPAGKWWVNRNTPVGEDADLYELKPYNGQRYIPWRDVIAFERP